MLRRLHFKRRRDGVHLFRTRLHRLQQRRMQFFPATARNASKLSPATRANTRVPVVCIASLWQQIGIERRQTLEHPLDVQQRRAVGDQIVRRSRLVQRQKEGCQQRSVAGHIRIVIRKHGAQLSFQQLQRQTFKRTTTNALWVVLWLKTILVCIDVIQFDCRVDEAADRIAHHQN